MSKLPSLTGGNRIPVDGSGVTQPVSGTVTANVDSSKIDLQYIKLTFNLTNGSDTSAGTVFLRKISEYTYESIRYAGAEDDAVVKIYLLKA